MAKKKIVEVSAVEKAKVRFNALPTQVKVLFYGGLNALFTMLAMDVDALKDFWWAKYLAVVVGVAVNLSAWVLLQEKQSE